jgi:hypothetical protein
VFHPVLLAAEVHVNIAVAEVIESPGRDLGVVTRPAAVHDDRSVLVRQQRRGQPVDLVGWHVDGSCDVGIGEVRRTERLHERQTLATDESAMKIVT